MARTALAIVLILLSSFANAITAKSYIMTEMDGTVLLEKEADIVRPIASITKVFTVRNAFSKDPTELITIMPEDMHAGRMRTTPLKVGAIYTRDQLESLALIASDNVAALALARTDGIPNDLPADTTVVEGSGLNPENTSSARVLAATARSLVETEMGRTSVLPTVTIGSVEKHSTNPLLTRPGWVFHFSKTGFINQSGGCLVVVFEAGGRLLTAVILGSRDVPTRWRDLYELRRMVDKADVFSRPAPVTTHRRYKSRRPGPRG